KRNGLKPSSISLGNSKHLTPNIPTSFRPTVYRIHIEPNSVTGDYSMTAELLIPAT
ncbi:MAG: hypothetical protein ACI8XU_000818, partial [Kiritimatiellia bacterium]